jgi:hypothetical protein
MARQPARPFGGQDRGMAPAASGRGVSNTTSNAAHRRRDGPPGSRRHCGRASRALARMRNRRPFLDSALRKNRGWTLIARRDRKDHGIVVARPLQRERKRAHYRTGQPQRRRMCVVRSDLPWVERPDHLQHLPRQSVFRPHDGRQLLSLSQKLYRTWAVEIHTNQ